MAHLEELTTFKEELFRVITSDITLMKALVNINTEDSLNQPLAKINGNQHTKPIDYMDVVLFDYPWIGSDLETEEKSYITVDIANPDLKSDYYKNFKIAIYVWCHQNRIKMINKERTKRVNRTDFIAQRIDKLINQSTEFGIGKLQSSGFKSERMTEHIPGISIVYDTVSFDRKNKPSERRTNEE